MLCEKCNKNEAVVFYRENVNGNIKTISLCKSCAEKSEELGEIAKVQLEKDFFKSQVSEMNSLFGSLFGLPHYQKKSPQESKVCNLCGASFADLVSEGKVGCPECYRVFAAELAPTISKIHGTTTHTGSAPEPYREVRERRAQIATLESELKSAVASEEYERAAELRDNLRELKSEEGTL